MITADTITDEQIRELRDQHANRPDIEGVFRACQVALGVDPIGAVIPGASKRARAKCAEVLNALAVDSGKCPMCDAIVKNPSWQYHAGSRCPHPFHTAEPE